MSKSYGLSDLKTRVVSEEAKSQIESILENLDLDLNIDNWEFIPNSDLYNGLVSIIDIDLINNNPIRNILKEVEYIREGLREIKGIRYSYAFIRTKLHNRIPTNTKEIDPRLLGRIRQAEQERLTNQHINILTGGNYPIEEKVEFWDYISQLDFLEVPDKWGATYWVSSIQIQIFNN